MHTVIENRVLTCMEEIEKLFVFPEDSPIIYSEVESTENYYKNKSTAQLRYDRLVITKILKERSKR